jgi:phosphoenolpyruvate carboxylase
MVAATISASCSSDAEQFKLQEAHWKLFQDLSDASFRAYRSLVEHKSFVPYFREISIVDSISSLNIGSRPAQRQTQFSIDSLRAIPWVMSWSQTRMPLPVRRSSFSCLFLFWFRFVCFVLFFDFVYPLFCHCSLLQGFYGFGSAIESVVAKDGKNLDLLRNFAETDHFFASILSNCEMVLSKSSLLIGEQLRRILFSFFFFILLFF